MDNPITPGRRQEYAATTVTTDRSLFLIHVEFVGNDSVWSRFGRAMVVVFVGAKKKKEGDVVAVHKV
jgi:hypothetical protein